MATKSGASKEAKVAGKPAEAGVIEKTECGVMFVNGKLAVPPKPEGVPVDTKIPDEKRKEANHGIDLKGAKKVKKQKKEKRDPTTKEAGKSKPDKTKELHTQFVGLIQELIPGSYEEEVEGDVYTVVKAKDGAVLTTIRDRVYPLRVASHKFLDGKAEKLENEKQMRDFITRVHKAYQEKATPKKESK